MHSSLGGLFLLVGLVSASRTFQPNCTIPSEVVNLVYAPAVRGTFNILWSSIFTVFICTWTVQHLNIPEQMPRCSKFGGRIRFCLRRLWARLNWMILFVIIPEFLVGQALQDYMMAQRAHKKMLKMLRSKNLGRYGDGKWWTMAHAFYANMGGFVLRRRLKSPYITDHNEVLDDFIDTLPSEQEIRDKSKGDIFVKGTAIVQVLWLLVHVTIRHSEGLPTSQLEIAVLSFSVCAFIAYLLFWEKPQGITTPTYIAPVDIRPRRNPPPGFPDPDMLTRTKWFQSTFLLRRSRQILERSHPIPNDIEYVFLRKTDGFSYIDIGAAICGSISGGLHCLAWSYPFPTLAEQQIWRACAFFITVCPVLFLLAVHPRFYRKVELGYPVVLIIAVLTNITYSAARLYIVLESLRAVLFLPPEAFIATSWSTQIPHVS
ncbi:hypothetical protein V8E54_002956 [Elaphomyces granulatus]